MDKDRLVEVMAPVGSWESLTAAFQGGADSIYFGIEQLNMRARSSINFTLEDLEEIAAQCHERGVKAYVTLNTILYDHDITLMQKIIDRAKEANIDAVIAMDPGAMMYAKQIGQPVHVSTQLNVTNIPSVQFYAQFSDVMVLSRELTLQQVEKICSDIEKQQIKGPSGELVRIECFVHGALCMAVSGKCYLSLHTMNSSANRGACKQNCRRTYEVKDQDGNELMIENEYIMSPKDLCTVGFIDKILDAGVSVLKIEGRSKGPDYVKEVTSCYKEAVQAWRNEEEFTPEFTKSWEARMEEVYNRGFWGGYFLGKKMGEWTDADGSKAKKHKVYLGKGRNYFQKIAVGEFEIEKGELSIGDELMITGPTIGVYQTTVGELRKDLNAVERVERGDVFSMPIEVKIRKSDKIFKIVERD